MEIELKETEEGQQNIEKGCTSQRRASHHDRVLR